MYEHPFLAPSSFLYRSKLKIRLLNREKLFNTEDHVFLAVSRKIFILFDAIIATLAYILVPVDDEFIVLLKFVAHFAVDCPDCSE